MLYNSKYVKHTSFLCILDVFFCYKVLSNLYPSWQTCSTKSIQLNNYLDRPTQQTLSTLDSFFNYLQLTSLSAS